MKNLSYLFLCFVLSVITFYSNAQTIPNADFENWTGGAPTGWYAPSNMPALSIITVSQSTDKQSGSYSAKLQPANLTGSPIPAILQTNNGNGLYTTSKPAFLNGYIKATLLSTDSLGVFAMFSQNSSGAQGGGADKTSLSRASWTPFHVTLAYPPGFTPDSFGVSILLFGSTSSSVYIDALAFSSTSIGSELGTGITTGVKKIPATPAFNSFVTPNPANGNSQINFALNSSSNVSIKIYDVTGRFVKTVLNETLTSGVHQVIFNADELHTGIYFYTINSEGINETEKFVVNK